MAQLQTAMCTAYTQLITLALPAALIGMLLALLGFFLIPLLGEGVLASRGYIRLALGAVLFLGFLPALITGLAQIGGFTGAGCAA